METRKERRDRLKGKKLHAFDHEGKVRQAEGNGLNQKKKRKAGIVRADCAAVDFIRSEVVIGCLVCCFVLCCTPSQSALRPPARAGCF